MDSSSGYQELVQEPGVAVSRNLYKNLESSSGYQELVQEPGVAVSRNLKKNLVVVS
jgi:hypothetical protein